VVSVCDCRRVLQLLKRGAGVDKELGVINEQLAMADVILLNKLEGTVTCAIASHGENTILKSRLPQGWTRLKWNCCVPTPPMCHLALA
jgi:hypothetical protein